MRKEKNKETPRKMQNTENLKKNMKTIRKTSALDVGLDFGSDVRADVKMSDLVLLGQIGSYIDLLLQAKEIGHCPMASDSLAVSDHWAQLEILEHRKTSWNSL